MEKTTNPDLRLSYCPISDKIIDLRHEILRPGYPRDSAFFDGDDEPSTLHFVAYNAQKPDQPICCASYYLNNWEGTPAYQLRGMATAKDFQKRGIGKALTSFAEDLIEKEKGINIFWCNARIEAVRFYEGQGWTCSGEEFFMKGVGPHIKMTKGIAPF